MIENPPARLRGNGFIIGWPVEQVFDKNGVFVGFVMPLAFPESIQLTELTTPPLRKTLGEEWINRYEWRDDKEHLVSRLKLIYNIAAPVFHMHFTGKYVLKDFKPENVLITYQGKVTIVDIDSIQISDGDKLLFPGTASTPNYIPPEFYNKGVGKTLDSIVDKSWDQFAMGVVFYQILMGIHPFVVTPKNLRADGSNDLYHNIASGLFPFGEYRKKIEITPPPHNRFKELPKELQNLFVRALSDDYENRSGADEWGINVRAIIDIGIGIPDGVNDGDNMNWQELYEETQKLLSDLQTENDKLKLDLEAVNKNFKRKSRSNNIKSIIMWTFFVVMAIIFYALYSSALDHESSLKYLISEKEAIVSDKMKDIEEVKRELSDLESSIIEVAPFVITRVEIANVYNGGRIETDFGRTIYSSRTMFLKPKIFYRAFVDLKDKKLSYKLFRPNGELSSSSISPSGYTFTKSYDLLKGNNELKLTGWGTENEGNWESGDYRLEIWYDSKCVFLKQFHIY